MKGRYLLLSLLLTLPLSGAPAREGVPLQELRLRHEEFGQTLHAQKVELDILHEKLHSLENTIEMLRQELSSPHTSPELAKDRLSIFEKRLATLEKTQETLVSDFKVLKNHLNDSAATLATCQKQIASLDKQLSQDVLSLKNSLHSMIALLKGEPAPDKVYTVKPGDSLGKIALELKVDIKQLKELNRLSSDRINVGQRLQLP